jgi:hypothetical protein
MDFTENSHTYFDNGEASESHSESTDNNNTQPGLYSTEQEGNLNQSLFDTEEISTEEVWEVPTGEVAIEGESENIENIGEIPVSDTFDQHNFDFGLDSLNYPDAETAMANWMGSDSHCENNLHSSFEELGDWTQDFAVDMVDIA